MRAVRRAGLAPAWLRHYNLALVEYLFDTGIALQSAGKGKGASATPGWRRTRLMERPLVRHGMHYGLEAQRRGAPGAASGVAPMQGEGRWVAQHLGSPQPLRDRPTAADVDAVLGTPADATGQQLSDAAFARGLHVSPAAAERFVTTVTADEAARTALAAAGYRELQQQLRTRVPPPAVMEAPRPQLGQPVGGDELPGPQPGMALQLVEAPQLEAMADEAPAEGGGSDGGEGEGGGEVLGKRKSRRPLKEDGSEMSEAEYNQYRRKYKSDHQRAGRREKREKQGQGLGVIGAIAHVFGM